MEFIDDLSQLYADFGTDAIVNNNAAHPVRGIFDAHYADALGLVAGTRPVFRAASNSPIVRGANVCIDGVDYTAKAAEPIDSDETLWPLEKV